MTKEERREVKRNVTFCNEGEREGSDGPKTALKHIFINEEKKMYLLKVDQSFH